MRNGVAPLIVLALAATLSGFAAEDPKPGNSISQDATLAHAETLIRQGQFLQAAGDLNAALESSPDWIPGLKLYARVLAYRLDMQDHAEELLKKCIKLAPGDFEAWLALGDIYLGQRRSTEAVQYLETAAKLAPRNGVVQASLALAYDKAGQPAKAAELYPRAVEMNRGAPNPDWHPFMLYGEYLLNQGDSAKSIPLFTEALRLYPESSVTYFDRAKAHEQLGQWQDAVTDAQAAIRYGPGLDARVLLVRVYGKLHDQAKVDEYTAQVKQLNVEKKAKEKATENSSRALRLFMDVVQPLLKDQKCKEAIDPSLKVLELWPSFTQPLFILGICYGQTGQPDQAISYLKKFLSVQPDSGDGHAALGTLLLQVNRKQEAREELQRALALDPSLSEIQGLLDQLPPGATQPAAGSSEPSSNASVPASAARMPASAAPALTVQAATTAMKRSDFEKAAGMLEAIIASKPSADPEVYIMLATCRSNLKQGAEAIEACERGLKQHSRSARLDEFYVSMLRGWAGEAEMKAKLVESVRRNPDSPVYAMALAEVLLMEDQVGFEAQIEPLVKKAVSARPLDPEAHYLYGRWACVNAHNDVSIRELTRALELTHDNDRAKMQTHALLGVTYTATHETAKAEQHYQRAIELDRKLAPFDPAVFMQYVKFLEFVQRADDSQKVIAELLQRAPEYGEAHLGRAQYLSDHDKFEEAAAEGELALKNAGQNLAAQREAHLLLAKTYRALGRTEEAKVHQDWVKAHTRS
jgi:tetratricopeptide (TPR) repeat protein